MSDEWERFVAEANKLHRWTAANFEKVDAVLSGKAVIVSVEPTSAMLGAGIQAIAERSAPPPIGMAREVWDAMIAEAAKEG